MYHMDGSVSRCLVSSAFCTGLNTKGVRLGDSATILQVELIAMSLALRRALFEHFGKTYPSDNILLYNDVMEAAVLLPRPHFSTGFPVMWVFWVMCWQIGLQPKQHIIFILTFIFLLAQVSSFQGFMVPLLICGRPWRIIIHMSLCL